VKPVAARISPRADADAPELRLDADARKLGDVPAGAPFPRGGHRLRGIRDIARPRHVGEADDLLTTCRISSGRYGPPAFHSDSAAS
jgi:hypothetical protein